MDKLFEFVWFYNKIVASVVNPVFLSAHKMMLNNGFIMVGSYNFSLNLYREWRKGGRTCYCVDMGDVSELSKLCRRDLNVRLSGADAMRGALGPCPNLVLVFGPQGHQGCVWHP